ncbi:MAG TPA: DPP IV N-terminal domain-containing protein [Tepidisphaeraceae bacterium]|nr:DPP IV N-terminal domain-containing protein [Tepidisphaeraceae bacterium]
MGIPFRTAVLITSAATLAVSGGCAKIQRTWEAASKAWTEDPQAQVKFDAPPVAQSEEAPASPAVANKLADAPDAAPRDVPAPPTVGWTTPARGGDAIQLTRYEPVKVPVVNVFGELDGKPGSAPGSAVDFGVQQHSYTDEGQDAGVAIDPTGRLMVYSSTRHNEKSDVYLQRVDGSSVTQLTSDAADDAQPTFSPDGKSVAFCSTRGGSWDLYTMDLDGRNVTQVTSGPAHDMHPTFAPDGKRLAYCSIGGRSGQWEIWVVDLTTRERRMVGYGLFPAWGPEKTRDRIAFQRARQRGSRWFSLWTLDLVDGEARRVTEVAASSNAAIVSPSWSPDGRRLAFSTIVEPALAAGGTKVKAARGQQDVWVVDADGGNRRRLTDGSGANLSPFWSADGRVYFVSDRGGQENVWSVRIENAGPDFPVAGRKVDPRRTPAGGDLNGAVGSGDASEIAR